MPSRIRIDPIKATAQFERFLSSIGFDLSGHDLRMDGRWHNVRLTGQRGYARSGGYRGWVDDNPQGQWINHRTGEQGHFQPDGDRVPVSPAEAERLQKIWREREQERWLEEQRRYEARAAAAEALMRRAGPADPKHAYLVRKGVGAHGIAQIRDVLLIPLRDPADGRIWSVQFISRWGEKLPLRGARKSGLSHMLGEGRNGEEIGIAEGYSTAASVHVSLGIPVAMAIDAGNLLPAARSLRSRYPNSAFLFAADNDIGLRFRRPPLGNVGLERAALAAREVGGRVSYPASIDRSMDFNDLYVRRGHDAVRSRMRTSDITL